MLHRGLIEALAENDSDALRQYLKLCQDNDSLAALDRESMGQSSGVQLSDIPVRGRV